MQVDSYTIPLCLFTVHCVKTKVSDYNCNLSLAQLRAIILCPLKCSMAVFVGNGVYDLWDT